MNREFTFCPLSISDLERYRDDNGFIDLDAIGLEFTDESREKRGDTERIKNWVDFAGTKVLIKAERMLEGSRNYGIYSELLVEELAKQLGLPAARYDLIKYRGQYGVLSYMMNNPEFEEFDTTYSLIGEPKANPDNPDICDYREVEASFIEALKKFDISDEEIEEIVNDRRKQKILQLFVCEADGHIENEGIIRYKSKDGRTVVRVADLFDNESAFLLDLDDRTLSDVVQNNNDYNMCSIELNKLLEDIRSGGKIKDLLEEHLSYRLALQSLVDIAHSQEEASLVLSGNAYMREVTTGISSKLAFFPTEQDEPDDYNYSSMTDRTLAYMRSISEFDEDIEDFLGRVYEELDIDSAISSVESKIKAPIPKIVKDIIVPFVQMRRDSLNDILSYQEIGENRLREAQLLYDMACRLYPKEKEQDRRHRRRK